MKKTFYLFFCLWSAAIVIIGFWPSYLGRLASGELETQAIIHIHAIVYSGWIVLFFFQALMVYRGQTATHKKVGKFGFYYGLLVLVIGLLTGYMRSKYQGEQGNSGAEIFNMAVSIRDMTMFGILFGLAMYYRKKPDLHRIWILGASAFILIAAVGRMNYGLLQGPEILFYAIWMVPILAAMLVDRYRKRPHTAHYLLLLGIFVAGDNTIRFLLPWVESLLVP